MYIAQLVLMGASLAEWATVAGTWAAALATVGATWVALYLGREAERTRLRIARETADERAELQARRTVALSAGVATELANAITRFIAADMRLDHVAKDGIANANDTSPSWKQWAIDQYGQVLFSIDFDLPMTTRIVDHAELYDSETAKRACATIAQHSNLVASVRSFATGNGFLDTRTPVGQQTIAQVRANLAQVLGNAHRSYHDAFKQAGIGGEPMTLEQFASGVVQG